MITLADKYQDAFRKLFKEESTIDGQSYTALSYAEKKGFTDIAEEMKEKMQETGLTPPEQPLVDTENQTFRET